MVSPLMFMERLLLQNRYITSVSEKYLGDPVIRDLVCVPDKVEIVAGPGRKDQVQSHWHGPDIPQ